MFDHREVSKLPHFSKVGTRNQVRHLLRVGGTGGVVICAGEKMYGLLSAIQSCKVNRRIEFFAVESQIARVDLKTTL